MPSGHCFCITTQKRVYYFCCENDEELAKWQGALRSLLASPEMAVAPALRRGSQLEREVRYLFRDIKELVASRSGQNQGRSQGDGEAKWREMVEDDIKQVAAIENEDEKMEEWARIKQVLTKRMERLQGQQKHDKGREIPGHPEAKMATSGDQAIMDGWHSDEFDSSREPTLEDKADNHQIEDQTLRQAMILSEQAERKSLLSGDQLQQKKEKANGLSESGIGERQTRCIYSYNQEEAGYGIPSTEHQPHETRPSRCFCFCF